MRLSIVLFCFLSYVTLIQSQSLIGTIVNSETEAPIDAANVFIAHTSIGTITDEKGNFELEGIPSNTFELIISHLGFETKIQEINPNRQAKITKVLRLSPNAINLTEVEITEIKESKRKRYFKRFQTAFLGSSPNAAKCQILNREALKYKLEDGKLVVSADELIQIKNDATGYQLQFLLEHFIQEGSTTQYSGKPLFVAQRAVDEKQQQYWEKQKQKTYLGSQQHFYKSAYEGTLQKEGFAIFHARLKNQSEFETIAPATLHQIFHESAKEEKQLRLNEFLKVVYTKSEETGSAGLSRMDGASGIGHRGESDMINQERGNTTKKAKHPTSYLFARKSRVNFQANGLPQRPELLVEYGHWSTEGVADLLPLDYKVEEKPNAVSTPKKEPQVPIETLNDFRLSNLLIPFKEIKKGGPPRDGIPSIDQPQFTTSQYANFINDEEEVLGVVVNGKAKAYPIKIMDRHEIVNDKFDGIPIAVTYCPLCGSGMAFSAEVNGEQKSFGVSGLLYNSDVLLYDRETESLWSQIEMKAIAGSAAGQSLKLQHTQQTTWGNWKERYPRTLILTTRTGYQRNYNEVAYTDYRRDSRLMFPVNKESKLLKRKDKVLGVEIGGVFKAYPLKYLANMSQSSRWEAKIVPLPDVVNGNRVLVHYNQKADSAYITDEKGAVIPATTLYWFAWYAFHPDTELFVK